MNCIFGVLAMAMSALPPLCAAHIAGKWQVNAPLHGGTYRG